eukprot:603642-Pelagomonas_calceolata.AAC.5
MRLAGMMTRRTHHAPLLPIPERHWSPAYPAPDELICACEQLLPVYVQRVNFWWDCASVLACK